MGCGFSKKYKKQLKTKIKELSFKTKELEAKGARIEESLSYFRDFTQETESASQISNRIRKLEALLRDVQSQTKNPTQRKSSYFEESRMADEPTGRWTNETKYSGSSRIREELEKINGVSILEDPDVSRIIQQKRQEMARYSIVGS